MWEEEKKVVAQRHVGAPWQHYLYEYEITKQHQLQQQQQLTNGDHDRQCVGGGKRQQTKALMELLLQKCERQIDN